MKLFLYCEAQDGGMDAFTVPTSAELSCLHGWMASDCAVDDKMLALWMATAEVGEMKDHRLGVCVRLKDPA